MQLSRIPLAQSIVLLCVSKGIKHVVISPGSRNAPLIISFSNHPKIKAYSIVDERCAAFYALGIAQQTNEPVAVVCTSGSALLNYYPAVAEAFYSDIPLVVISADRPVERIDIGDGQTIRQKNVYQNHILYSANLYSELTLDTFPDNQKLQQKFYEAKKHNEREINLALNTAIEQKGPVHINVPFYEPLYETIDKPTVEPLEIQPIREPKIISKESLSAFAKAWNKATKKLVLVGVNQPNAIEQHYLDVLAEDASVLVMCETTSNIHHKNFITRIDKLIAPIEVSKSTDEEFKKLQPEILVTFGGMVISKKIKAFLRKYQPEQHWHVDNKKALNTYFCLNKHFDVSPNEFFGKFLPQIKNVKSNYQHYWLEAKKSRDKHHKSYMSDLPFCDLKAFEVILKLIPKSHIIHFSNSSIIRYAQLFKFTKNQFVYCNRGTSGIDGSTSTAIGHSIVSKKNNLLITGDLSFLYDSNALWFNNVPKSFRIIILNNQGGGIFRILPGAKDTKNFDQFLETQHNFTAEHLAKMYHFDYASAESEKTLSKQLNDFFSASEQPKILEVFTPRENNDTYLKNYFKFIL
ncbi:2-succinyl-5-enolpyruvyl-6-hydroxy-3-cyclohexene-1-carboxylic-acid synthase [Mesonia sp. K7]|uniref:2-succinyl-5-enolpyruvyl-6-hydroxy-3- cyclohexene-1-carboxylic-acid synthase n=1 Tax=Mesonia sp. K7 TaxID=2218606 RepID=UPI000DAA8F39|nr:2-succinyl-5-enolpyruvyl-6-hydroxy-3-cyclohexene-1-carboxylic-acid synthase [Mesonia sp. K7]PZD78264.1 2-succinyl-5-enolpyruvyl-6-hydroxy-3-cyclohexene-1-carboxylic-acid synthase [Mesonia sp. K7]